MIAPALLLAVFTATLRAQCPDGTPPPCAGARPAPPPTVAVLYFADRSRDTADAYLADGLTEEIIGRLVLVQRLEVRSRTAVAPFRDTIMTPAALGRALHATYLVSGSLQHAGGRLRVSVELVRASTGTTAWAGQFDRLEADLLDIQSAIADTVAQALTGQLLPGERRALIARPTIDPQAYDHYLRGSYSLARRTPDDVRLAIREFESAVRLDPRFAPAHARIALANAVALDWGWGDPATRVPVGLAESARALALDSNLADGWTARGYILRFADARGYAGVRDAFARAIALSPRDAEPYLQLGWALAHLGDEDGAIATLSRAVALDPDRAITRFTLAWVLLVSRRYQDVIAVVDTAIARDPTARYVLGMRAWARLSQGETLGVRADIVHEGNTNGDEAQSALAALDMMQGDSVGARAIARQSSAAYPPAPARIHQIAIWSALAFATTGGVEQALDLLGRFEPAGLLTWWLTLHPGFDPIRHDPRFERFVAGLAPPGQ